MMSARRLLHVSLILALASLPRLALAEGDSQTYITVNGKPISKLRADAMATTLPPVRGPQEGEARRRALGDELVRRELLAQEAAKSGIDNRPDVRGQMELASQGVLVGAYLSDYVRKHPVTDEAIRREYEAIRSTLGNREYKVRQILLGSAAEATAIIEKLGRGAKFADLAAQSKDRASKAPGGEAVWTNAAAYSRPIAEALVRLQKGGHTLKPVQSELGWHVMQLDDVRNLKVPTLAELKPQLTTRLQQQIVERHIAELRAKAQIQ